MPAERRATARAVCKAYQRPTSGNHGVPSLVILIFLMVQVNRKVEVRELLATLPVLLATV
jgi:hypothetical protein